jgi:hypothetical protein
MELPTEEVFWRVPRWEEFDVAEGSLACPLVATAGGIGHD